MTPSAQVFEAISEQRTLAIVRLESEGDAVTACRLLADAGMRAVEISLAQPDATAAIAEAAEELSDVTFVGAGTVRTVAHAAAAVGAGAQFLVSPGLDEAVAAWAQERDILYLPGALTPTEVETASRWSPLVKLFPAGALGPGYVRDLRAPFPDVALVPTGGVDLENACDYLDAGAAAVAIGSALVNQRSVAAPDELTDAARRLLQLVAPATPTTRRS
jgi:2-dehydro-3-deoxyphosphogluconate aldolase/(4S)-4-hydroxy-2-oxoglutarate aldolase